VIVRLLATEAKSMLSKTFRQVPGLPYIYIERVIGRL